MRKIWKILNSLRNVAMVALCWEYFSKDRVSRVMPVSPAYRYELVVRTSSSRPKTRQFLDALEYGFIFVAVHISPSLILMYETLDTGSMQNVNNILCMCVSIL